MFTIFVGEKMELIEYFYFICKLKINGSLPLHMKSQNLRVGKCKGFYSTGCIFVQTWVIVLFKCILHVHYAGQISISTFLCTGIVKFVKLIMEFLNA